jgi:hypothetical protein
MYKKYVFARKMQDADVYLQLLPKGLISSKLTSKR